MELLCLAIFLIGRLNAAHTRILSTNEDLSLETASSIAGKSPASIKDDPIDFEDKRSSNWSLHEDGRPTGKHFSRLEFLFGDYSLEQKPVIRTKTQLCSSSIHQLVSQSAAEILRNKSNRPLDLSALILLHSGLSDLDPMVW